MILLPVELDLDLIFNFLNVFHKYCKPASLYIRIVLLFYYFTFISTKLHYSAIFTII